MPGPGIRSPPKSGSWNSVDRAKSFKEIRISTASQFFILTKDLTDSGWLQLLDLASLVRARRDTSRSFAAVKDDRFYLHHMLECCHRITRLIGPGREKFMASEQLQHAVSRNVEVTGVAACRHFDLEGMRDVLIHDYIGVDLDEADTRTPGGTAAFSVR